MNRNPKIDLNLETNAYRELCCHLERAPDD